MQDLDGLPDGGRALEHIDARLTVFIHMDSGFRHAQSRVGDKDDVRRLLPQERDVLHIPVAGEHQQPEAGLIFADAGDGHFDLVVKVARECDLDAVALRKLAKLARRDGGHIVPGVTGNELARRMLRDRLRLQRVVVLHAQAVQLLRREHGLIAVHRAGEVSGRRCSDRAGVLLSLAAEGFQLVLGRGDLRGDDGGRALVGASAQDKALQLRRKVGDGVHVPAADIAGKRGQVADDLQIQRGLIGDAGRGTVGVIQLLELTGQLGDAGLAVLRVAGEVAGGDRLSGGHARALLRGQNGDAVF